MFVGLFISNLSNTEQYTILFYWQDVRMFAINCVHLTSLWSFNHLLGRSCKHVIPGCHTKARTLVSVVIIINNRNSWLMFVKVKSNHYWSTGSLLFYWQDVRMFAINCVHLTSLWSFNHLLGRSCKHVIPGCHTKARTLVSVVIIINNRNSWLMFVKVKSNHYWSTGSL